MYSHFDFVYLPPHAYVNRIYSTFVTLKEKLINANTDAEQSNYNIIINLVLCDK